MTEQIKQILETALERLQQPGVWKPGYPFAECEECATTAVWWALKYLGYPDQEKDVVARPLYQGAIAALHDQLPVEEQVQQMYAGPIFISMAVFAFNDAPGRTLEEIVDLYQRAIAAQTPVASEEGSEST